jgi:cellulose synthase/poly-beta-1,6-N-acetylglucosamine synthase-like glycosyltransferase
MILLLEILFWLCAALLVWTHVGYALFVAVLARVRPRLVRGADITPTVTLIIAAHNEADVIEATVTGLIAQDYPADRLRIVVASDGSTDDTDATVERLAADHPQVTLLRCSREGKVAAQDRAVRFSDAEIVAFSDANGGWEPNALRVLVRNFADPDIAYVCGNVRLRRADGTNREGMYWRYELWLRNNEARIGSITAGNGGIYAVRRSDYLESDGRAGHDLGFPYQLVQRGRRAISDSAAIAWEKPARDLEDEFQRKIRMSARCWQHVASGRMFRGVGPLFLVEVVSHRLLRYGSGILHIALFVLSLVLAPGHVVYLVALVLQLLWLAMAAAGRLRLPVPLVGLAYYYLLITVSTLVGLSRYLRVGVPVMWEQAEGTR